MTYILSIDQGTSSTRALIFDENGKVCGLGQYAITQHYPSDGWVEHCPDEIWKKTMQAVQDAIAKSNIPVSQIKACGITNQRETTVLWDKETGEVVHPAIVWQDRRTSQWCKERENDEAFLQEKTGLVMDSYFSASKIHWLLNHCEKAKALARKKQLAFGTIDSFLIWRLTKGKHATDVTNASRTLLYNIDNLVWDDALLAYFSIPASVLPKVKACDAHFGDIDASLLGHAIPITGVAGDQQAATVGQACFSAGMIKATFGTGCFLLLNTGNLRVKSQHRLLTTIAYQINEKVSYGLEGSIFNAGTAIQWVRDELDFINEAALSETLAKSVDDNGGVYMVPAFTGLGAPHWDAKARGAFLGLQRDSKKAHLVRSVLEAVCYQTEDVLACMHKDCGRAFSELRVDGGMVANDWLLQFLSNVSGVTIKRPLGIETTAKGAAMLAGLGAGIYTDIEKLSACWQEQSQFMPDGNKYKAKVYYDKWQKAVEAIRLFAK